MINVLITRGDGIPGAGAGRYLAWRYRKPRLKEWEKVSREQKIDLVERERQKIFAYKKWAKLNRQLFGNRATSKLRDLAGDSDCPNDGRGGLAESDEHKRLKRWVSADPTRIGLSKRFGKGSEEYRLMSGDEVDVMFMHHATYRAVECKSVRSGDLDLKRGIYQCVKYREVKAAEMQPYDADVTAILVTERELPSDLKKRAAMLGVKCKCVAVNT